MRRSSGKNARSKHVLIESLESRNLFAGIWSTLATTAPYGVGTMTLLPDGSVIATNGGNNWSRLTPNASGSYINGTWTRLAAMHDTRLYDSTQVLQDGRFFIAGGEYGTGGSTGEVYNPITNTWTQLPAQSYGKFIDSMSTMLPDGRVLIGPVSPTPSGYTTIFDPTTNTWSQGPKTVRGGSTDEQSWVKLPDDSILTIDGNTTSERYIPSQNKWIDDAAVPAAMFDNLGEIGAGLMLSDGRAFYIGSTGHTLYYTPSGSATVNGTWAQGPDVPGGLGQDDAPAVLLADGKVLMVVGPKTVYSGPSTIYLFDPVAGTYTTTTGAPTTNGAPYVHRFLELPDGTVLLSTGGSTVYDYNPNVTPVASAVPTISSLTPNSDGTVTLTGTLLNGVSEGAAYGDDAQMSSNYPIVRLVSGSNVYYARTSNWDSTGVATGATLHTTNFTLPLGIAAGTYSVYLVANGISSTASAITISMTSGNVAPTIATAAAAVTPAVGVSTTLSVLGTDDAAESNLTYTWATVSVPSGKMLPSFSINGTNASKNTTVTFTAAGTYTFKVYVTDAGGLSVTSSTISVVVTQTKTSIAVSPVQATNTASTTRTFTATAYDQFGTSMSTQPTFTWSVTSGAGTISTSGVYTAPSTGTLANIHVTDGTFSADAEEGVVDAPWASSDIGTPLTGQAYTTGSTFTVEGGGADIWGTADDFRFVYRTMSGDGVITARVATQPNTGGWAKSGVMFRNSLADTDQFVMMSVTPSNGTALQYRATSSASAIAVNNLSGKVAPYWVRLVRIGNVFSAYYSANGTTWTLQGTATVAMGTSVYVGLAVDANNSTGTNTSTFDNVSVNAYPTISTPASANANPVTGTTTILSVLGADDAGASTLIYTWVTTGTPPATVTYSANASNAAKSSVATFTKAGTYTFQVTITDTGGLTTTSVVTVVVNQTPTAIVVTPSTTTIAPGQSTQFTAIDYDQFGNRLTTSPNLFWTITSGGGSLDTNTGLYTADNSGSSATISATDFIVSGSANITITGSAPQISSTTASAVSGKTSNLSVVATDDAGESNLIYTWSALTLPSGALNPKLSTNGNNAAKNAVATFSKAGTYVLGVVVQDSSGMTTSSSVSIAVSQSLTSIIVSPSNFKVTVNTQQQFKAVAYDQFGVSLFSQPTFTWASTSGTVSSAGLFTAGSVTNISTTITASSSSKSGSASITTRAAGIPLAPGNASIKKLSSNTLSLSWRDNSTDETSFEIQYGTGTSVSNVAWTTSIITTAKLGAVSTVTYSFGSAFATGSTYYFRVRAVNASGASSWSNVVMQAL